MIMMLPVQIKLDLSWTDNDRAQTFMSNAMMAAGHALDSITQVTLMVSCVLVCVLQQERAG